VAPEGVPDTVMAEEQFSATDSRHATQQVKLASDGLLRIGSTGRCLSAAAPSNSSVFGRKLDDGWAVLLINCALRWPALRWPACVRRAGPRGGAAATSPECLDWLTD
jgi:hypothetical protein